MQKVVVVILNYRVAELTVKCIQSVLKSTYKPLEIIVVDNNSKDGIKERINKIPKLTFIQSEDNLGYAGGNNLGMKAALKTEAEYIFILNPDAYVTKDTIALLLEEMNKNQADIANPKIYYPDSNRIWFAGKIFDKANVLSSHRGVDDEDYGQFDQP